jgi:cyclophilin family peptidyl-prolyl cis-trans isomerase/HEAT repeat protein
VLAALAWLLLLGGQAADAQPTREPAVVLNAERAWEGADVLLPLLNSPNPRIRAAAIRALGRLEDPAVVPRLLPFLDDASGPIAAAAAMAIAQAVKTLDPSSQPELIAMVNERLVRVAGAGNVQIATAAAIPLGRIAYRTPDEVKAAERALAGILGRLPASDPVRQAARSAATRGLESLARVNAKLISFDAETIERLETIVSARIGSDADSRRQALGALIAARVLAADTERAALADPDEQVRRLAVLVLIGPAGGLDDDARADAIGGALREPSALVRYDAARAYIRRVAPARGCGPLLNALRDPSSHVVLAVLDGLGDACPKDDNVTMRLVAEARTPPTMGSWHREAHAFLSLAKRSPERAAISMSGFASHPVWQVRMYAARAAAAMHDELTLERLADDRDDNVREAVLTPLFRLKPDEAMPAVVAALKRPDYQLLRSAALILKEVSHDVRFARPLLDTLVRVTREGKETSRDTRLALLDAIARHGDTEHAPAVSEFLTDFDPKVAEAAAALVSRWSGTQVSAHPRPPVRGQVITTTEQHECVAVDLKNGHTFRMSMLPEEAPLTVDRFLELAIDQRYYDNLTFHRIVPNFVIQGGSPGANEYAGQGPFMRDEIGRVGHLRGTVGVSTRGRNTGDAQFFVNLVDNARLDGDYTVFARVFGEDMPVVDAIEEGETIGRIRSVTCR